jgi:hypothetical protein
MRVSTQKSFSFSYLILHIIVSERLLRAYKLTIMNRMIKYLTFLVLCSLSCVNKTPTAPIIDQTPKENPTINSSLNQTSVQDTNYIPEVFDPRFTSNSRGKIELNTVFYIDFELNNVSIKNNPKESFKPPSFEGLHLVSGPDISNSTVIISGDVKRSTNWRYTLLPLKNGTFLVGPATVKIDNKIISTRPLEINTQAALQNISEDNKKLTEEGLKEFKKITTETDKSEINDVWVGSIYRNKKYHFRVKFPDNWEYDKGMSINTVARAFDREYGITLSVAIQQLPLVISDETDIYSKISSNEYKEFFRSTFEKAYNTKLEALTIDKSILNNRPAYMLKANYEMSSLDQTVTFMMKSITCLKDSKYYSVQIVIPADFYNEEIDQLFRSFVKSFIFEHY